jgi:hypothetical protein
MVQLAGPFCCVDAHIFRNTKPRDEIYPGAMLSLSISTA